MLTLLLAIGVTHSEEESDVMELDKENFYARIADLDIVLVEFYAPW